MDVVSKYPVDFEALEKGTRIEQVELEDIFGCTPNDAHWGLKAMKLISDIQENAGLLARQSKNAIIIMTDAEAAEYTYESMFKRGVRKIGSSVRNRQLIDVSQLSAGALSKFESQSRIMTGTQQATLAALKKHARVEKLLEAESQ